MFGTILISIITFMNIYVLWRVTSVPFIKEHISLKILIGAGLILWASFVLGRKFGHGGTGVLARTLEMIGMNWMAVLFLIFICLFGMDLVTGFGLFFSRLAPSLRGFALIAGVALSLIALVQGLRPPVLQSYEVLLKDLPDEMDGTEIVTVCDLHIGSVIGKRWLENRVAQVQEQQPDLVVLLGDIFEGHGRPQDDLLQILSGITAPLGVWAVTGNHEFHRGNKENVDLIKDAGFQVLHDRWIEVRPGFILAGVDDLTSRRRAGLGGDPVSQALKDRPPGATIFLSHTPWETEKAAEYGVGLMISGHTHGGQIWPFGYLVRLRYPLLEGRYEVEGMTVIVCRGTGTWGPRMRLWRPSEIVKVILRKKQDAHL